MRRGAPRSRSRWAFPALVAALALLWSGCSEVESDGGSDVSADGDDVRSDAQIDAEADALLNESDAADGADSPTDGGDHDGKTGDSGAPLSEACGNFVDDDGDKLIDEGCWAPPNLLAGQTWLDYGLHNTLSTDELGPTVDVTIAAGQRMLWVARDAESQPSTVVADRLKTPSGDVLLGIGPWSKAYGRAFGARGIGTLLLGGSDAYAPGAGGWQVGFRRAQGLSASGPSPALPGWLHVGAVAAPAAAEKMKLSLDVYVVAAQPVQANELAGFSVFQQTIAHANKLWAKGGLQLEVVSVTAVDGDDGKTYKHVDLVAGVTNELPGLVALAAKLRPKSAHVPLFLVSSIDASGQPSAAGFTGNVAGPNGLQVGAAGAVVLVMDSDTTTDLLKADPTGAAAGEGYGRVLAHELGHLLGLWHTTEQQGDLHDVITDTSQCQLPKGHSIITALDCPTAATNLMFPQGGGEQLSAGQTTVARRHPAPQ